MILIGDVHGYTSDYKKITDSCESSIQVGDLNFDYDFFSYKGISTNHKFFCGNHDNPDKAKLCKNNLGRFGKIDLEGKNGYFVSGAWSIDRGMRQEGYNWWANEQLSYDEMTQAIADYQLTRPEIVLSHDCPLTVRKMVWGYEDRTITASGLEMMFNIHAPRLWVFGHMHYNLDIEIKGTRFICLPELKTFKL